MSKIPQSEFIRRYYEDNPQDELAFNNLGRFAFPCSCEDEGCTGWQMGSLSSLKHDQYMERAWTIEKEV